MDTPIRLGQRRCDTFNFTLQILANKSDMTPIEKCNAGPNLIASQGYGISLLFIPFKEISTKNPKKI